jgi:hypothetical protein
MNDPFSRHRPAEAPAEATATDLAEPSQHDSQPTPTAPAGNPVQPSQDRAQAQSPARTRTQAPIGARTALLAPAQLGQADHQSAGPKNKAPVLFAMIGRRCSVTSKP